MHLCPEICHAGFLFEEAVLGAITPTLVSSNRNSTFKLSGVKLASLSQAMAYQHIQMGMTAPEWPTTMRIVEQVLRALAATGHPGALAASLWRSIRHADFQEKILDFLWKVLHGAHCVGRYREKIPQYEHRGTCSRCGMQDSLEHILIDCQMSEQVTVWALAQSLWKTVGYIWKPISFERVLRVGLEAPMLDGPNTPWKMARLWHMLVSESAYLIWRLRCD